MSNVQSKALVVATAPRKADATLDSIFACAKTLGSATREMLTLLRTGKTDARREQMAKEFQLGRICGALQVDRAKAEALIALKPYDKKKAGADRRNATEQGAVQAARSLWSSIGKVAGFPNKRNGATRAPRATVAPQTTPESIHIKRCATVSEFHNFALLMVGKLGQARTMNEQHLKLGDLGTLCRDFEAAIKAYKAG